LLCILWKFFRQQACKAFYLITIRAACHEIAHGFKHRRTRQRVEPNVSSPYENVYRTFSWLDKF
jgi:hypothetical protein